MIYTHVLNRGPGAVRSPMNRLVERTGVRGDIVVGGAGPALQVPHYTASPRRLTHPGRQRPEAQAIENSTLSRMPVLRGARAILQRRSVFAVIHGTV